MLILCSQIRALVEKGLLQQAPHWDLGRAVYLSCIAQDTAKTVADTVRFPLHDHMYNYTHNSIM